MRNWTASSRQLPRWARRLWKKGVHLVNNVDEKELAQSAEKGIKDIGNAAKGKVMKWIDSQKVSPKNEEVPNLKVTIKNDPEI